MDLLWSEVLLDIEQADAVLVNSEFVRETFLRARHDPARLRVIYWGVDDAFLDALPPRGDHPSDINPLRMLFAGGFEERKGARCVLDALRLLEGLAWYLEIASTVDLASRKSCALMNDARVSLPGWLSREELAKRMAAAELFVFPSLAEGSARVVFEALAAGCYVITTPNAGSIVQDGIHGRLVPPGDPQRLAAAIREAAADRSRVAEIGRRNGELVRSRYRQSDYGEKLAALYEELLANGKPGKAA